MSYAPVIRVVAIVLAFLVWGYGARVDDSRLRMIGIALFVLAVLLRFFVQRSRTE